MSTQHEIATTRRSPKAVVRDVLEIEAQAILGQLSHLDESFDKAIETVRSAPGRLVCSGKGTSGLMGGERIRL